MFNGIFQRYEFEADGSFRSPNSVHQILDSKSTGTASDLAKEVLDEYSAGTRAFYNNYSNPGSEAVLLEWPAKVLQPSGPEMLEAVGKSKGMPDASEANKAILASEREAAA